MSFNFEEFGGITNDQEIIPTVEDVGNDFNFEEFGGQADVLPVDINPNQLSPEDSAAILNQEAMINDVPMSDLDFQERQRLNDAALMSGFALPEADQRRDTLGLSQEARSNFRSGLRDLFGSGEEFPAQFDPTRDKQTVKAAFAEGLTDTLTLGFADEINGFFRATEDLLSGKIPDGVTFGDRYRSYRDIKRKQSDIISRDNPIASFFGTLAGATALPAGKFRAGLKLGQTIAKGTKVGTVYGALFGAGGSEADLTKGEYLPAVMDTSVSAAFGFLFGGIGGALKSLGRGGRRPFRQGSKGTFQNTGKLDGEGLEGAAAALATANRSGKLSSKYFEKADFETLSKMAKAAGRLDAEGIIDIRNFRIDAGKSTEKVLTGLLNKKLKKISQATGAGNQLRNKWNDFTSFFYRASPVDYEAALFKASLKIKSVGEQLDDLYVKTLSKSGKIGSKADDVIDIYGDDISKKLIKEIEILKLSADTAKGAQSLQQALNLLKEGRRIDIHMARNLMELFGSASQFDRQFTSSKSANLARSLWKKSRDYIKKEIRTSLPDRFDEFRNLNESMSELELGRNILRMGRKFKSGSGALDPGFTDSTITTEAVPGAASQFFSGVNAGTPSQAGKHIGDLLTPVARTAGFIGGRPKQLSIWASKIYSSFVGNRVTSMRDKQLHRVYIENNNKLTSVDKVKQLHNLNETGEIDLSIIPDDVREQAQNS